MKTTKPVPTLTATGADASVPHHKAPQDEHFKERQKLPDLRLGSATVSQVSQVPANELEFGNFYHL